MANAFTVKLVPGRPCTCERARIEVMYGSSGQYMTPEEAGALRDALSRAIDAMAIEQAEAAEKVRRGDG